MIVTRIARTILVIMAMTIPAFAVGSVNQSLAQIPGSTNYVFTENWVGDAITGSVPATVMSGTGPIQGYRIVSVEVAPGSPAPTNLYSITVTDFSGADILGGTGVSLSNTAASILPSVSNAPPLYGSLTVNVTGNSVASAQGRILVYFAPVSQVIGNTPTGAGLTTNNIFSGTNTFTGNSNFTGPIVGTTIIGNLNTVIYVGGSEPQVGASADMGAQINAAYTSLPSTGGTIVLLPQTGGNCYNFSTPITFNTLGKYVLLDGEDPVSLSSGATPSGGSCLNYTPVTATTAITLDWTPSMGGGYIPGAGLRDLVLTNNACVTNGGCGSSAIGVKTGTTNGGAHKAELSNVRISGFGTGLNLADVGGPSWGMMFKNFSLSWNTTGFLMSTLHENLDWIGGACAVNTTCFSDSTGTSINVMGVSFDSNVTVAVTGNAIFSCFGCYSENLNQANFQLATVSGGVFSWINGNVVNDNNSGTLTQFITSTAGQVNFDSNINSAGQTVTNILNNSGGGTGDINWSTPNPTLIASGCATTTFCFTRQRSVSGQPPRIATPSLAIPADTVGVGGLANTTTCRHNAAQNWLECTYNNDAFGKVAKVNQANTWANIQSFGASNLVPSAAGGTDLGTTALPFGNAWLGTAATNNFKVQPAATTGARIITITDPVSPTTVGLPLTIASGTATMTTALIASQACGTVVTVAATGVATTDSIYWNDNAQPAAATNGVLPIKAWPTSGNVNFFYCNPTAAGVTPAAATLNWRVAR